MRICATGKLPIADAKWSAVLRSRSLTVEFTSAVLLCNSVTTIPRISDLSKAKKKRLKIQLKCLNHKNSYLTTASISSLPQLTDRLISGTNSFASYLRRIHDSFSSRDDCAVGFVTPLTFASYTEFDRAFPIESITLKCDVCSSSRPSERTLLICEPRFRWIPEHSIQIKMPKLNDFVK